VRGLLLRVLEDARNRDVGDVVAVELHETEFEDETHQHVEVGGVQGLRVEHLVEAALGHAVVAGVEVERRFAVLDDVAVDLDASLEVLEFVLAAVELEDLGGDAFVRGQEVQLRALAAEFGEGLGEEADLGVLQVAFLDLAHAVAQHDHTGDRGGVVGLEFEDRTFNDVFERDFGLVGVAEVCVLALGDVVRTEDGEVGRVVAEDRTDRGVAAALFVVDCEDHGAAAEPAHHGLVEGDFVSEVVGQFEHDVIHEVKHDHFEEVALLEGLGEDDLVGHVAFLLALLLHDLVLAREQVLARARVEHHHDGFGLAYVPVEALHVAHFDHVRVRDAHALEFGQLVLHFVHHGRDFLLEAGRALLHDDPAFERVFGEADDLVGRVLVGVVVAVVVVAVLVVRGDDGAAAEHDVAGERALDVDDVEVVREVDAVFTEEPVRAQRLQRGVAEGLELEVFQLAAFDRAFDTLVVVDVFVFDGELAVLQPDHEGVALETQVAQRALHHGREPHDFDRGLDFLLGREFVELELGVGVGELAVLEHGHQLVLGDAGELLELLAQRVGDVAVEDAGDLVVDVEFHGVGFEDVHGKFHAVDHVDVFGVAHTLARVVVEEGLLALAAELQHVFLLHGQDVAALVHDRARVALLALQFDDHLEGLLLAVGLEDGVEAFVGLRFDDLDEGVVVDVTAEEHLL